MKKLLFSALLIVIANCCLAQFYISVAPALTNDAGTIPEKANLSVEFGKQWDVFSLGLDIGKTSLGNQHGNDTSAYLEVRPNLNVFQQCKFTDTFTAGIGYILNSNQSLLPNLLMVLNMRPTKSCT